MQLSELTRYLDDYLRVRDVPDAPEALNGLQVDNAGQVTRIAAAVDLCEATVQLAVGPARRPAARPSRAVLEWTATARGARLPTGGVPGQAGDRAVQRPPPARPPPGGWQRRVARAGAGRDRAGRVRGVPWDDGGRGGRDRHEAGGSGAPARDRARRRTARPPLPGRAGATRGNRHRRRRPDDRAGRPAGARPA